MVLVMTQPCRMGCLDGTIEVSHALLHLRKFFFVAWRATEYLVALLYFLEFQASTSYLEKTQQIVSERCNSAIHSIK